MKSITLLLLFSIFSVSHNYKLKQQNVQIAMFWKWFISHKDILEHLTETNRDKKLDLVLDQLNKIQPGLAVEISDEFKGTRDFVISANGDIDKFSAVKAIVSEAPHIKGWKVTAFRQKAGQDFTVKYGNLSFKPSQMFFYPNKTEDGLDIIVYVKGIANQDKEKVNYYGLIAMDNVLGEYDSVTKVKNYIFQDLETPKNKKELRPVSQLPDFIRHYYSIK